MITDSAVAMNSAFPRPQPARSPTIAPTLFDAPAANATAQTALGCEKKPPSPRVSDGIRGPPHLCTFWSVFHVSACRASRRCGITGSDPWRPLGVHDQHRDGAMV